MSQFYGLPETHPLIVNETQEIQDIMEATQGDHPWYEAFTGPRMFYRVALAMSLQMLQQLTGANYFFVGFYLLNITRHFVLVIKGYVLFPDSDLSPPS
jgi:hypothetical protein